MARVTIIGAHGKVALRALPLLVQAGHQVQGLVRREEQAADVAETGASPVVADVEQLDVEQLTALLQGQEVVVWSAGAGGGAPSRTMAVDRDAAIRTIDAAVAAGVPRFVMVSYFGAGPDHGIDPSSSFHAYAEAKAAADQHLQASPLQWTLLKPSTLTLDEPTGLVDTHAEAAGEVSRGNVAQVLAAVVDAPQATVRRSISFNDGSTPVSQAVAEH